MGRKTRFVIGVDGGERELFSVEESARGGLTLNLPLDPPVSALHVCPIEHRFSVHESQQAKDGGFLIKETFRQSDGNSQMNYAYVRPNGEHAMLPAFGRLAASLRNAPDSAHKPRRTTVTVFKDHSGGPVFSVVTVSAHPIDARRFPRGTTLTTHSFGKYYLYVTSGVFLGPAGNKSATVTMMSAGPVYNGVRYERVANFDMPEAVSPVPSQLAFYIEGRIADLAGVREHYLATSKWEDPQPTAAERIDMLQKADFYMPNAESDVMTSVKTRLDFWRANPPESLFIHPTDAEVSFRPAK